MHSELSKVFQDLTKDLLAEEGPRLTTMRNYSFAILVYPPQQEFAMRQHVRQTNQRLGQHSWSILEISLQELLMQRLKSLEPEEIEDLITTEKRQHRSNPERALNRLKDQLANILEGEEGLASDVIQKIQLLSEDTPLESQKTLIWINRLGSVYPFFRCSSLLKYLDGRTGNLPVVMLYPGSRKDLTALSFMDHLPPDRDYRPRIYSSQTF